ncbi:MAG: hypothetical protein LBV04_04145 [Deferribacteraceae bacterium]|nr:hypothetical protein [Deferribacteraceae bacterium]
MKKIIIAIFLTILVAVPVALYVAANYFFKKQLEYAAAELGVADRVSWSKSGINIFGRSGYITDVRLGDITAERITFSRYSYKRTLTIQLDNLTVPVTPALGRLYDPAYMMGYTALHMQSTINCVLTGSTLDVASDNTNIVEIGKSSFALSFSDISSDRIIPALTSIVKQDKPLSTMTARLDNSADVVARAVNVLAMVTNSDYDHAKARLLDAISRYSAESPDASKQNLLQLHRLISNPSAVVIQLAEPLQPKELLTKSFGMNDIGAWRTTGQELLMLPILINAY